MRKTGIGVAGCGASVWMHGPAIAMCEDAEVVAWMDVNVEAAEAASTRYGGRAFSDFDAFLDCGGLNAVIIATPNRMHSMQTIKALGKGKHVLCEKPMARTISECRKMIDSGKESKRTLMVGFMKRFDPSFAMVNDMIRSEELGDIIEIYCDWGWPQYFSAGQRDTLSSGGGLLIDHGCHTVDMARWWAGEIESVYARVKIALQGREVDDYSYVTCQHKSGCVSVHEHSRLTHRLLHESYRIEGTKGCVTMDCAGQWSARLAYPFTVMLHTHAAGIGSACRNITPQPAGDLLEQARDEFNYTRQLRSFINCIRNGADPELCAGRDGYAAVEVVNAAYVSANEERVIRLPLDIGYDYEKTFRELLSKQKQKIAPDF